MAKKRNHGEGAIDARGENVWRLRYRVSGRRFTKTFRGTKTEAQKALRVLLHAGDTGAHVEPDRQTFGAWVEHWLSIGAPSSRRRWHISQRSLERYTDLLQLHALPKLGARPLQQIQATELDDLYEKLSERTSPTLATAVHQVMVACLGTAFRTQSLFAIRSSSSPRSLCVAR